jgi:hypothetical protein
MKSNRRKAAGKAGGASRRGKNRRKQQGRGESAARSPMIEETETA